MGSQESDMTEHTCMQYTIKGQILGKRKGCLSVDEFEGLETCLWIGERKRYSQTLQPD